jgi:pectate lyase
MALRNLFGGTAPIISKLLIFLLVLTIAVLAGFPSVANSPAFTGAEGFGAATQGGQGGQIIAVTNLNDRGAGSLRAAIDTKGPRIVVFRVGGTIVLDSSLRIRHPNITVAGQTATPLGITLRNSTKNAETPLKIETHDVIIRYLRSRPGSNPKDAGNLDALTISGRKGNVYHIMVDHCSFSWATDEVVSTFYDAHDITIQWSFITEGLDCATHTERGKRQCHSMGMLLGSDGSRNLSIHHNLFAHNRRRNPLVKNSGVTDIVNNVIYNSGFGKNSFAPTQVMGTYRNPQVNYVGNYFRPGKNTKAAKWWIDTKEEPVSVYAQDNRVHEFVIHPGSIRWLVNRRHPAPAITTTSAETAYAQVLAEAGATGSSISEDWVIRRDAIDERIVAEVRNGVGQIIDDPTDVELIFKHHRSSTLPGQTHLKNNLTGRS